MRYRPALDGVRAIAVLAVIAYHVSTHVPGGFLGVDCFFVLSGYLITTLLMRGLSERGLGALGEFWTRRARRLLPALLILVAVSAVVVGARDSVATFAARRADMIASLFYYANWHFIATDQSYFALYTGVSPLRHLWSLAIEEQFYLLWPLLLFGAIRATRDRRSLLLGVILASVAASAVDMALRFDPINPSAAYYATDARAQQLLIGAALAVLMMTWRQSPPESIKRLTARGWPPVVLALLAFGVLTRADASWYARGGAALFALAVAAFLLTIELHPASIPARFLSLPPVRWVGMISYGLYLWHWPLIVWLGDPSVGLQPHAAQLLEVVGTFLIAAASFYLLERPIRSGRFPLIGRSRLRFAGAISLSVLLVAVVVVRSTEIGGSPAFAAQLADTSDVACPSGSPTAAGYLWCVRQASATPDAPVIATAGDSTARAMDPGLVQFARTHGWQFLQVAQGGCSFLALPLAHVSDSTNRPDSKDIAQARQCQTGIPKLITAVMEYASPRVWVYSDRFIEAALVRPNGTYLQPLDPRREAPIKRAFKNTLRRLTTDGGQVILIPPPPKGPPPDCAIHPVPSCQDPQYSTANQVTRVTDKIYGEVAATMPGRVIYVSITDILCPDSGHCPALIAGKLARFDSIHYTATFSRRIVPIIIARAQRRGLHLNH